MNLELTRDEAVILARLILGWRPQSTLEADVSVLLIRRICDLPVPMESNGAEGPELPSALPRKDEQLPGGVSGRPQGGDQPQRTPQTIESVRMSAGKYDREAVEQITLTPTRIERKDGANGPYLSVTWPARGRGFLSASCFDEKLFAWVAGRVKQETVFYIVHSGKYTNIVGVKA